MREIRFRAWMQRMDGTGYMEDHETVMGALFDYLADAKVMQYTGIKDKYGVDIYEGDIMRFSDKWEWYRGKYAIAMMCADGDKLKKLKADYENEPYEIRTIDDLPEDYEWLLGGDIQTYWEVIGNIHQNLELLDA